MLRSLEIKILFCEIFDCTEIFREYNYDIACTNCIDMTICL